MILSASRWAPCFLLTLHIREDLGSLLLLLDLHRCTARTFAHFFLIIQGERGSLLESITLWPPSLWTKYSLDNFLSPVFPYLLFLIKKSRRIKMKLLWECYQYPDRESQLRNTTFCAEKNAMARRQMVSAEIVWLDTSQQTVKWPAIWFLPLDKKLTIAKEHCNVCYAMYWHQWWPNFIRMHPATLFVRKPLLWC